VRASSAALVLARGVGLRREVMRPRLDLALKLAENLAPQRDHLLMHVWAVLLSDWLRLTRGAWDGYLSLLRREHKRWYALAALKESLL